MKAVVSSGDATIIAAIVGPLAVALAALITNRRSKSRAAQIRAAFDEVRRENTEQHATGQELLRALVDSHHHLGERVDHVATRLEDHIDDHDRKRGPHAA